MFETARSSRGMVTSPHRLASDAGLDVLKAGGTAVEAAIAAAAAIAVVYPHMNGIGGDGFWLISEPGRDPIAIDACGRSGASVDVDFYARRGLAEIPGRGPLAAITVAGAVSGWKLALEATAHWQQPRAVGELLRAGIHYAEQGFPVPRSFTELITAKRDGLRGQPGFVGLFMPDSAPPAEGVTLKLPALGATLRTLAANGLDSFYRGPLAQEIATDLAAAGSPLTLDDLASHAAERVAPLAVSLKTARVWNLPAPTQGLASLLILGLFERLGVEEPESFSHVHGLVEATKRAFIIRNAHIADPGTATRDISAFLEADALDRLAAKIDGTRALPWPHVAAPGDTIWLGVIDGQGRGVSYIQSLFHEFGSGVVLPRTGIVWQNRGVSFRLEEGARNRLGPRRKTMHTLNPAFARFVDGRDMVYGCMGGEGQPQTQGAFFSRYGMFDTPLQRAITMPRWLLGRTWGEETTNLKIEDNAAPAVVAALRSAGHEVELVPAFSGMMGHAGAIVRHADGRFEGATDPRSDGAVAAW